MVKVVVKRGVVCNPDERNGGGREKANVHENDVQAADVNLHGVGVDAGREADKVATPSQPEACKPLRLRIKEIVGEESGSVENHGEQELGALTKEELCRVKAQCLAFACLSRNAPVPSELLSSMRVDDGLGPKAVPCAREDREGGGQGVPTFEELQAERESRRSARRQYRTKEIDEMLGGERPMADALRLQLVLERKALQLSELQRKVRFEVAVEKRLLEQCAPRDRILSFLGQETRCAADAAGPPAPVRLLSWEHCVVKVPRDSAAYGDVGQGSFRANEEQRRRREAERRRRLALEERVRAQTERKRYLQSLLQHGRDWRQLVATMGKRRKHRNDGVLAWHSRERQRATRAERMRLQALRSDDQEAYMRLVEESKNERLQTLLDRTAELLSTLGDKVMLQKSQVGRRANNKKRAEQQRAAAAAAAAAKAAAAAAAAANGNAVAANGVAANGDGVAAGRGDDEGAAMAEEDNTAPAAAAAAEEEEEDIFEAALRDPTRKRDLLADERAYNHRVHTIKEKVLRQPAGLVGGELRSYQLEGLEWMLSLYNNNLSGILADEMGLGKTIQTISLLVYLMEHKDAMGPHLIIAPKAVLPNWANECTRWCPGVSAVLYDGKLEDRKLIRDQVSLQGGKFNILLTHYDLVMRDKSFLSKVNWDYLIVDEGHRLKNSDCQLAMVLAASYSTRHRLLLTGTPIQNTITELWSLLNFLLPSVFNSSENFEQWFNAPFAAGGGDLALTEEEELLVINRLHRVIRPFILRRKKKDVEKDLPSKTQVILKCDLSAWQRLYYSQIVETSSVGILEGGGTKSRGLQNTAMQLRKCCNHPYLFFDYHEYLASGTVPRDELVRASGKFELLDRLLPKLKATGHRVLLFSQMTKVMDLMEQYLALRGMSYLRLDGTTKTEERGEMLADFNAESSEYFIFLLSTRAGGLGLNLQSADTVILFDSDWNPQMDQQAEDRAHRIGQRKEVRVFVLVSVGSIEEVILERAGSKLGIDAKVIQAGMFDQSSTAAERREMLEEIIRKGSSNLGEGLPSEREINRLAARNDEEYEIFERMDEERRERENYTSRLIGDNEVPEWVFAKGDDGEAPAGAEEGLILTGERARRARKEVVYSDTLTDRQFAKMIEESAGDGAPLGKRRRGKSHGGSSDALEALENGDAGERGGDEERLSGKRRRAGNSKYM
eukprot:jgi/Mesvir1/16730/Mv15115-RA.2